VVNYSAKNETADNADERRFIARAYIALARLFLPCGSVQESGGITAKRAESAKSWRRFALFAFIEMIKRISVGRGSQGRRSGAIGYSDWVVWVCKSL